MTKRTESAHFQFHNKVAISSQMAVGNQWMMFRASSFNSFIISQRALSSPHHRKLIPLSVSLSSRAVAPHMKCSATAILTSLPSKWHCHCHGNKPSPRRKRSTQATVWGVRRRSLAAQRFSVCLFDSFKWPLYPSI